MVSRVNRGGFLIDLAFAEWVDNHCIPGTGVNSDQFWLGLGALLRALMPKNEALLEQRKKLQAQINTWHHAHPGEIQDTAAYRAFLHEIGYLVDEPAAFEIETDNVDPEIAHLAGPQLVVPVMNARYALNAANARWGSLYDALYGTDVIPTTDGLEQGDQYNEARGAAVVAWVLRWLNETFPIAHASHADVVEYRVSEGALSVRLSNGQTSTLKKPSRVATGSI